MVPIPSVREVTLRRSAAIGLCSSLLLLFTVTAFSQSIAILEPLEGTTVWGREVSVRWTVQDVDLLGIPQEALTYYLVLRKGTWEELKREPAAALGKADARTQEERYTLENLNEGPYTLFILIGDVQGRPSEPLVQSLVHFRVIPTEKRGTTPIPDWLIFTALGALVAVALWLNQRG